MIRPPTRCKLGVIVLAMIISLAGSAHAGILNYTLDLTNGAQSANVLFQFDDSGATTTLSILLTNTMTTNSNPSWLNGLFFNLAGSPTMSYLGLGGTSPNYNDMVVVTDGGGGTSDNTSAYGTVTADHFWALNQNITNGSLPFGDQQYGLGAAGFGVFPQSSILNFQAGGPTPQPDGSDGGILSGYMIDNGILNIPNGHTGPDNPFVDGALWLDFDLGNYDITTAGVSDVAMVYGTSFGEVILQTPEPATLILLGLGLTGAGVARRRKRKA